ncbi:MAG: type IV pilus secretin PilQ [Nitrospinales bacterium]
MWIPLVFAAQKTASLDERMAQNAAQPAPKTEAVRAITGLTTEQDGENVSISIEASDAIQYTAFKLSNPIRLIMDLPRMREGILTRPMEVNRGVVQSIHPIFFKEAEVLRLEVSLNSRVSYSISQPKQNRLLIRLQPVAQEAGQSPPAKKSVAEPAVPISTEVVGQLARPNDERGAVAEQNPTGDPCDPILAGNGEKGKISFDFQQADLRNILRIIAETSGLNLVISPEVAGTITMKLINVPWNVALNTVMRNNGLGRECFNGILRVATQSTLDQEAATRATVEQARTLAVQTGKDSADMITQTVRINYADILALIKNLKPMTSPRGKITMDKQTNTIILTDTQARIDRMAALIETLDVRMGQVMIEARIVEVNKNFVQSLGIQWGGRLTRITPNEFPNTVNLGPPSLGTAGTSLTPSGFIVDLPSTAGTAGGLGLALGSFVGNTQLDIQLSAIETQGKGRILSSPKVTTLNNRKAVIRSGRRIPFKTVSQDGTQIQFVDADISLTVTPHITADGNIYMRILATKNAADFAMSVDNVPSITTKEAQTEVLVKNGETTVLGGLYENTVNETRDMVPLFGKIPLLGALFRRQSNQDVVNELLIFITPTIVENIELPASR